jgi:ubiquinone/menaquinone biosynthesis C-methylase UbiE
MNIFLPGSSEQVKFFLHESPINSQDVILLIGASHFEITNRLAAEYPDKIVNVVDDYDNLMLSRIGLTAKKIASISFMEFDKLDFPDNTFTAVYAQASISIEKRGTILEQVKRVLKPEGILCIGEMVNLKKEVPQFVHDIWNNGEITPLFIDEVPEYYSSLGFNVTAKKQFSLQSFYTNAEKQFKNMQNKDDYQNRVLKRIKHECNAYLNLGGSKYMGILSILARNIK